jgi:hypothetical protein
MNPKQLLWAPPIVWSAIGITALVAPQELGRHFYIFWPLNDAAIALALIGIFLTVFRGPTPAAGATGLEWAVPSPAAFEDMHVGDLLRLTASHARRGR